jgi:hypothetical protein
VKIIDSLWFTGEFCTIGIVVVQYNCKDIRAYIGVAKGKNKQMDERMIAEYGAPFYLKHLHVLSNLMEPIPKINGKSNGM